MATNQITEIQVHFTNGSRLFLVFDENEQCFRHYCHIIPMIAGTAESVISRLAPNLRPNHRSLITDFLTTELLAATKKEE